MALDDKERPASGTKEEEVMSEVTERSMEANMKILVGNEIAHAKRVDGYTELALSQAITFQQKANDAYLEQSTKMADAYMEQSKKQGEETLKYVASLNHHAIENNRFTLDRLYGIFPEEAAGIATMLADFLEYLRSKAANSAAASTATSK